MGDGEIEKEVSLGRRKWKMGFAAVFWLWKSAGFLSLKRKQ